MNYKFQWDTDANCDSVPDDDVARFSDGSRPAIDERHMDENAGVCGNPPVDFNDDGLLSSDLSFDLNADDEGKLQLCGGVFSILEDNDDWTSLSLASVSNADQGAPIVDPPVCAPVPDGLQP